MERPLVSIIVPSFNQGRFIRRTLESIVSQEYRPIEVIVVDGASTDETVSILEKYGDVPEIRWISEPDSGVVEAVNKGFERARGEIAAIQSSDDFYLPGAVEAAVSALQAAPELAFVFGDVAKVDADGLELSRTSLAEYSLEGVLSLETWIPQPSTFFRLSLARSLGGWRTDVPFAADTDLWLRMGLQAPARRIPRLMAQRTMHDAQRDRHGARIVRDFSKAVRSLPGLANMPASVRNAARAGILLQANRYDSTAGAAKRMMRLWLAAFAYPRLWRRFPLGSFVPGWYPLRDKAVALKQRLE